MTPIETDTTNSVSLQAGRRRTHSGLSHSCERPTSISPAPSAQTISVALARRETIRMLCPRTSEPACAARGFAHVGHLFEARFEPLDDAQLRDPVAAFDL